MLANGRFEGDAAALGRAVLAMRSYLFHVEREFGRPVDPVNLRGQDNVLRHLPVGTVVVRLHPDDGLFDVVARIAAVRATGNGLRVSLPPGMDGPVVDFLRGAEGGRLTARAPVVRETDAELAAAISAVDRIRYAAPERVSAELFAAAAETGFYIARTPVVAEGRVELLQYYRQQSICTSFHRYGNLGERAAQFEID
jgi:RHH-type proline utilization regulon transcriptional repressor/proline dehydrogenase/delta 1-pyrroline-5-carboxylate dehydrogenase